MPILGLMAFINNPQMKSRTPAKWLWQAAPLSRGIRPTPTRRAEWFSYSFLGITDSTPFAGRSAGSVRHFGSYVVGRVFSPALRGGAAQRITNLKNISITNTLNHLPRNPAALNLQFPNHAS